MGAAPLLPLGASVFASRHVNWSVSVTPAPNQPSKPLTVAGEAVAPSIGWIYRPVVEFFGVRGN